jgi:hypothetical protein
MARLEKDRKPDGRGSVRAGSKQGAKAMGGELTCSSSDQRRSRAMVGVERFAASSTKGSGGTSWGGSVGELLAGVSSAMGEKLQGRVGAMGTALR